MTSLLALEVFGRPVPELGAIVPVLILVVLFLVFNRNDGLGMGKSSTVGKTGRGRMHQCSRCGRQFQPEQVEVVALKNRAEIAASELRHQLGRLDQAEAFLLSAISDDERAEADHDLMSARSRVGACLELHRSTLAAFDKSTQSGPGSLLKSYVTLAPSARTVVANQPALIDLREEPAASES